MSVYPKWLYHATQEAKVVQNEQEHKAQGPEWQESPDEALKVATELAETEAKKTAAQKKTEK